ncbi:mechanosensitive ion channel family protein [Solibacillus sp. FSL H8-0538]|uniref:mechanosensitive ion channel family protein n=1 Tax=Solibacillus sp. FSL H8-0538 TaxID=2921400 RepID=UPI0030FA23E9
MLDSIRWLIPNVKEPTMMDVAICLVIIIVGWLVQHYVIKKIINWNVKHLEKKANPFYARVIEQFSRSIRYAFFMVVIFFSLSFLIEVSLFSSPKTQNLFISFMVFYVFKGIHDLLTYYTKNPSSFYSISKDQDLLTPFFLRISKVIVMLIALFTIASLWNFNLNGFLTGIGLTGVALAFGIRDTLGHVFGGLSVALDKPFQIGDWVATEDFKIEGFIEDINLRSTLIQTGDKGLVYVPNSYLVNRPLYNLSKRTKRKCELFFYVSTENSEDAVRKICEEIREQIYLHKKTDKDIIYVNIDEMRLSSFRMLIRFYVVTNDMGEMLEVKQDILFAMNQILEDAQILVAEHEKELWVHQEIVK